MARGQNYKIQFDTTADTAGVDKLATAMGKVTEEQKKLDASNMSDWGRSMLDASRRGVDGMTSLVRATSDVIERQNFVDQVFTDANATIGEWAETADQTALLSKSAALEAASYLGIFGQRINLTGEDLASFSINLAELAGDMASIRDTKPEDAVRAIGAAMRNEYEPMRRYGVVLNDSVLKARVFKETGEQVSGQLTQEQKILAVNSELYHQLGFAIGDVERTFETFANQERYMRANLENLKAEIGEGLTPAFLTVLTKANSFVSTMRGLPEPVKVVGTRIALLATTLLGVGGASIYAVGKIGPMIGSVKEMGQTLQRTLRTGTAFQKGLVGLGAVGAAAATAAVGLDIMANALNAVRDVQKRTDDALAQSTIAVAADDMDALYQSFIDLANVQRDTASLSNLWEDWGAQITLPMDDTRIFIEELDAAFQQMLDQDPTQAALLIGILKEQQATLDPLSDRYKKLGERIAEWEEDTKVQLRLLQAQGVLTEEASAQFEAYLHSGVAAAGATDDLAEANAEAAKSAAQLRTSYYELNEELKTGEDAAEIFAESVQNIIGVTDNTKSLFDFSDGLLSMIDAFKDDEGNIDSSLVSFDRWTEAGQDTHDAVESLAKVIESDLTTAYSTANGDANKVIKRQNKLKDEFTFAATAAGLSTEKIWLLADALFATDEEIKIQIELAGQEAALQKIQTLGITINDIPDEFKTEYAAAVDEGDFIRAWELAERIVTGEGPLISEVEAEANKPSVPKARKDLQENIDDRPNLKQPVDAKGATGSVIPTRRALQKRFYLYSPLKQPTNAVDVPSSVAWTRSRFNYLFTQKPATIPANAEARGLSRAVSDANYYFGQNPGYLPVYPAYQQTRSRFPYLFTDAGIRGQAAAPNAADAEAGGFGIQSQTNAMGQTLPGVVTAGRSAPTTTGPAIGTINVYLPAGVNEVRVVDALRNYQRKAGTLL